MKTFDPEARMVKWLISGASLAALALVGGCDGGAARDARWRARANDPPQFWSASVIENGQAGATVRVCADRAMREGFTFPLPISGGQMCALEANSRGADGERRSARCVLSGREYAVGSLVTGDPTRDFTVAFQMGATDDPAVSLAQTRRYQYLGACPKGWAVGDNTDRQGRLRRNALE